MKTPHFLQALYWALAFIFVNLFFPQSGNPNPASRLATMAEMSESGRFEIDRYVLSEWPWTNDWSRNEEGYFYSNKAPGPMLLGFPLFWIVDQGVIRNSADVEARTLQRRQHLPLYNRVLSVLLQVLPFAFFVYLLLVMPGYSSSLESVHWTALAALFGNTVALLMNTYFGHGLAAVAILVMTWGWLRKRWDVVGLGLGLAVLCDYAMACFVPPVLGVIWFQNNRRERFKYFCLGVLAPLLCWVWYHTVCFGRPWRFALMYQSPEFQDLVGKTGALWGIIGLLPNPANLMKLLFGSSRGILVTQPWVLLAIPLIAVSIRKEINKEWKSLMVVGVVGFLLLLWMNSAFGGWHGGGTIGPRYLSPAFPLIAFLIGHLFDGLSKRVQAGLWVALIPALILGAVVVSTTIYTRPDLPLWSQLLP